MTDVTASQIVEAQLALARVVVPIVVIGSALLALLVASCICWLCCGAASRRTLHTLSTRS